MFDNYYFSEQALALAVWSMQENNRSKAVKLAIIAVKMEAIFRKKREIFSNRWNRGGLIQFPTHVTLALAEAKRAVNR